MPESIFATSDFQGSQATTLWEDSAQLVLSASRECTHEFIQLIEKTGFGSDGLSYRRLGVADSFLSAHDNVYVSLRLAGELVGTYVLTSQRLAMLAKPVQGVYRSGLCVAKRHQGKGYGRLIVSHTLKWLDTLAVDTPVLSYGCIEQNNQRSLSVLGACGARELGHLHTQMIYRQWPRSRVPIVQIKNNTSYETVSAEAYRDCGLRYAQTHGNKCFAVVEGSTVIAAAKATVVRMCFDHIGQPWDFLSEYVFKYIGPARKRFDPKNFTYLKLDHVVVTESNERMWRSFLDTLMAKHHVHMAMFALDPAGQVTARLEQGGVLGRVAKATRQQLVVVGSAHGASNDWLDQVRGQLVGLGPLGQ